ncbi:MAG TPA: serine O-acetyltransferase EpsC [Abditibacteriaceae bacterium]|nr:serine O-acetyltransferase EpsC [Abditibacteriaceae bacterium]
MNSDAVNSDAMNSDTPSLLFVLREDIRGMILRRSGNRVAFAISAFLKILLYPRIQAVILFRFAHALHRRGLAPLAYALQAIMLRCSGAEIHPAARIGPGLCLVHSSGVVIGDRACIGAHFICYHGVTVGDSGKKDDGQPVIGDWVKASAGAKILGSVTVGDHAIIGANAVVLNDVPPYGVAVGIPARVAKFYTAEGH